MTINGTNLTPSQMSDQNIRQYFADVDSRTVLFKGQQVIYGELSQKERVEYDSLEQEDQAFNNECHRLKTIYQNQIDIAL